MIKIKYEGDLKMPTLKRCDLADTNYYELDMLFRRNDGVKLVTIHWAEKYYLVTEYSREIPYELITNNDFEFIDYVSEGSAYCYETDNMYEGLNDFMGTVFTKDTQIPKIPTGTFSQMVDLMGDRGLVCVIKNKEERGI